MFETEKSKTTSRIDPRTFRIIKIVVALSIAGGLLFFLSWFSWRPGLLISHIVIKGDTVINTEDITHEVRLQIAGNYFGMFAKSNTLLYSDKTVNASLLKKFPRILYIEQEIGADNTLTITIHEREPFALWCDHLPAEDTAPSCYFLDKDGYVFDHSPDFSGDAYFKYYGRLPYEAPIGSYYLASTTEFHELASFVTETKELEISPLYIVSTSEDDFDLYVFGGGKIMFQASDGLPQVAERLSVMLKTKNLVPRKGSELLVEYIDLRFGNKLFFKERKI